MRYRPILPRIVRHIHRCLTQPDRPEPPHGRPERFPQRVDYIVHTDPDGTRTEHLRIHLDIDNEHHMVGTFPLDELHLVEEVERDRSA